MFGLRAGATDVNTLESSGPRPSDGGNDPVPRIAVRSAAFLSDVHANAPALAAILAELAGDPVEALVLNGDITWGTWPSATIDLIESEHAESVVFAD